LEAEVRTCIDARLNWRNCNQGYNQGQNIQTLTSQLALYPKGYLKKAWGWYCLALICDL
jgi:hypothetical protein